MPARLLGIGLPLTIAFGTLAGVGVLPGVSLVEALVLSIMLACTDAALGQAVVTDDRVPSRIRQGLNVESGLNDGICVPLFFIALALAEWDEGARDGAWCGAPRAGGDRLRPRRRRGGRHPRRTRAPAHASAAGGGALAADPDGGYRSSGGSDRDRPRRQHVHRRLHRGVPVRRHRAATKAGRCPTSSTRAASCSTPSRSSSSAPPSSVRRSTSWAGRCSPTPCSA